LPAVLSKENKKNKIEFAYLLRVLKSNLEEQKVTWKSKKYSSLRDRFQEVNTEAISASYARRHLVYISVYYENKISMKLCGQNAALFYVVQAAHRFCL
jgi:hypothetical protein